MILVKRIASGVAGHFQTRVSEWLMVWPCAAMGVALNLQPDMFDTSPSFDQLRLWFGEQEWAFLVLMCAIIRLIALTVNGTFVSFPYSPHMRIFAAFVSGGFWFQYTLGFTISAIEGVGAASAIAAYSTFVLAEAVNAYRSSLDLATVRRR